MKLPIIIILFISLSINAQEKKYIKKDTANLQAYTYSDGKKLRTIWLLPNYIAEVESNSSGRSQTKGTAAIKIRKLQKGEQLSKNSTSYLPVYSAQNSEHGMKLVATGKIIVFLKKGIDGYRWAESKGYRMEKKFPFGNIYVLNTPKGKNSLEFTSSLLSYPEVKSAQPDFWKEVESR